MKTYRLLPILFVSISFILNNLYAQDRAVILIEPDNPYFHIDSIETCLDPKNPCTPPAPAHVGNVYFQKLSVNVFKNRAITYGNSEAFVDINRFKILIDEHNFPAGVEVVLPQEEFLPGDYLNPADDNEGDERLFRVPILLRTTGTYTKADAVAGTGVPFPITQPGIKELYIMAEADVVTRGGAVPSGVTANNQRAPL